MFRIPLLIIVIITAALLPFWAFVVAGFIYALFFTPYEIMIIALFVDAQFGDPERGISYLYTLATVCIFFVTLYTKPYLRFY